MLDYYIEEEVAENNRDKAIQLFNRGYSYIEIISMDINNQDTEWYDTLEEVAKDLKKYSY